jgi:hypothetical protein
MYETGVVSGDIMLKLSCMQIRQLARYLFSGRTHGHTLRLYYIFPLNLCSPKSI